MPLPNHLSGSRPSPSSSSPYFEHAATTSITRQPSKTIYNVYTSKKRTGGEASDVTTSSRSRIQSTERTSRGSRPQTRTATSSSSSPSSRCPTNGRTRSATPARNNSLMSRSAGTGFQPTSTWIPSAGRFNTSPRTYYSKARTLEAERQAALASAAMAASSPASTLSSTSESPSNTATHNTPTRCRTTVPHNSSVQCFEPSVVASKSVSQNAVAANSSLSLQVKYLDEDYCICRGNLYMLFNLPLWMDDKRTGPTMQCRALA